MSQKYLTVVYEIDDATTAREILGAHQWTASSHSHAIHDRDVARLEIESLTRYDQQALELCNACGWKALAPGDCCVNCRRNELEAQLAAGTVDARKLSVNIMRLAEQYAHARVTDDCRPEQMPRALLKKAVDEMAATAAYAAAWREKATALASRQATRIDEMESQLDAVGAGGVVERESHSRQTKEIDPDSRTITWHPEVQNHCEAVQVAVEADEVLVAIKRPEGYEDVHPALVAEDALPGTQFEYRVLWPLEVAP